MVAKKKTAPQEESTSTVPVKKGWGAKKAAEQTFSPLDTAKAPSPDGAAEYQPEPLSPEERAVPETSDAEWNAAAPATEEFQPPKFLKKDKPAPEPVAEKKPEPVEDLSKRAKKGGGIPGVELGGNESRDKLIHGVERVERLMEEMAGIRDDVKEILGEMKAEGFDVATIRKVLKYRATDHDKLREQQQLLETYLHATGDLS